MVPAQLFDWVNFSIIIVVCCLLISIIVKKYQFSSMLTGGLLALICIFLPIKQQSALLSLPTTDNRIAFCTFSPHAPAEPAAYGSTKQQIFVQNCIFNQKEIAVEKYVILYMPGTIVLDEANTYQGNLKLKPIRGLSNPGTFDYEKWAFSKELIWRASLVKEQWRVVSHHSPNLSAFLRKQFAAFLTESFQQLEELALLKALTIGDKADLSPQQMKTLQVSGLMHLFVISGLHLGLVAFYGVIIGYIVCKLVPNIQLVIPRPDLQWSIGWLFASTYWLLLDESNSVFRAWLTLTVFVTAHFLRLKLLLLDKILLSIFLVVLLQPFAVFSVGFYLTIGALISIWAILFLFKRYELSKFQQALCFNVLISIAMMPVLLAFGFKVSIVSPIINMLFVPVFSFILMPLLIILLLLLLAGITEVISVLSILVASTHQAIELTDRIMQWFPVLTSNTDFLIVGLITLLALSLIHNKDVRYTTIVGLTIAVAVYVDFLIVGNANTIRLNIHDVGQGTAVSWQDNNTINFYDTGSRWQNNSAISSIIDNLQDELTLDYLFISHNDNDHAGGEQEMLAWQTPHHIIRGEREGQQQGSHCIAGQSVKRDNWQTEIIYPFDKGLEGNSASCVILLTLVSSDNPLRILLTGDISTKEEQIILKRSKGRFRADILILSHHGSKNSNSSKWLQATEAKTLVATTGFWNHYNHPHPSVKDRIDTDVIWLNTAEDGALTWTFERNSKEWRLIRSRSSKMIWNYLGKSE